MKQRPRATKLKTNSKTKILVPWWLGWKKINLHFPIPGKAKPIRLFAKSKRSAQRKSSVATAQVMKYNSSYREDLWRSKRCSHFGPWMLEKILFFWRFCIFDWFFCQKWQNDSSKVCFDFSKAWSIDAVVIVAIRRRRRRYDVLTNDILNKRPYFLTLV